MRPSILAAGLCAGAALLALTPAEAPAGVRGRAATSIHHGPSNVSRHTNVQRGGGNVVNRQGRANVANRSGNRIANNSGNRINTGNVNIGNDVNIDVDRGWDGGWGPHPVARGVAFGTAAAVTAAAVGSLIYSLPPACAPYPYRGFTYYSCGGVYYEPRYQGDTVVYVVVDRPG